VMRQLAMLVLQRGARLVLLLYPRQFRVAYGHDAVEVFKDRCTQRRGSTFVVALASTRELLRMAGSGIAERLGRQLPDRPFPQGPRPAREASRPSMSNVWRDIRFAFRVLVRSPGFSLTSIAVLAIGIGGVTLMFSTLNGVVLQPLEYEDPDRLTWIWGSDGTITSNSISALNYWDYRDDADAFESMAAILVFSPRTIITGGDEPERVISTQVSHNFFSVLGVEPQIGRAFVPAEEENGSLQVVVLSDGFWQRRHAGNASIVGQAITISGMSYQVIGVLPPDFSYRDSVELWFPMWHEARFTQGRDNNNFSMFGRLADGVTVTQAQDQMDAIATSLATAYPDTNERWGVRLESMHEVLVGDSREMLFIMLGLVGLVLVIASANVASLALARAVTRRTEVAIRLSLGAARSRVVRQLLTESVLVALAGGVAGLALASAGIKVLQSLAPADLPRIEHIGIDATVLAFTFGVSMLASLAFGIVPALRGTGISLSETLKVGTTRSATAGRSGFRNFLVVSQVALSLMLIIASGLLVQSYARMQRVRRDQRSEGRGQPAFLEIRGTGRDRPGMVRAARPSARRTRCLVGRGNRSTAHQHGWHLQHHLSGEPPTGYAGGRGSLCGSAALRLERLLRRDGRSDSRGPWLPGHRLTRDPASTGDQQADGRRVLP